MAAMLSPFAQQYKEELTSLKNSDRQSISFLKNLAAENKHEHLDIIVAVQEWLYQCPEAAQLPLLYLVDCIMKTVGEPYMFRYVWDSSSHEIRKPLLKLAETWTPILPAATVTAVFEIIAPPPVKQVTPPRPQQQEQPRMIPSSRIGSMRLDPRLAAQKHAAPQPCAQQQQPHFSSLAIAAHNLQQALSLGGLQNRAPAPMAHIVPHSAASAAQQGAGLHTLNLPLPPPQPAYASVATLPQSIQPMQVPSHPQPFPTQQAVLQQNPPYFAGPSPGAAPLSPRPAAPVAPSNEELMAALLSLSSKLGGGTAAGKAGGQATSATARSAGAGAASTSMQHYGKVTGSLSFHPSILKEHDQSAIDELLDATEQTRRKFLDIKFLRNRRIKAAHQSSTPLSQRWYYSIDNWLTGAREDKELSELHDEDAECEVIEEHDVEEDPSQPECAISGEPFERWYDPDSDKWFYSGAVVLTGDEAASQGVMEGSIVKVHCLGGAPSKRSAAAKVLPPPAMEGTATEAVTAAQAAEHVCNNNARTTGAGAGGADAMADPLAQVSPLSAAEPGLNGSMARVEKRSMPDGGSESRAAAGEAPTSSAAGSEGVVQPDAGHAAKKVKIKVKVEE